MSVLKYCILELVYGNILELILWITLGFPIKEIVLAMFAIQDFGFPAVLHSVQRATDKKQKTADCFTGRLKWYRISPLS
jgi:hypothetical protein